jgi:hypothetical protein
MIFSPRVTLPCKPALALVPALVPHSGEVIGNLTNLQWVAAPVLILLLIARDADTRRRRFTDVLAALLIGLTGVFSTLLAPFFIWRAICRRTIASVVLAGMVTAAGAWQGWTVLRSGSGTSGPVSLDPVTGLQIVALRTSASVMLPPSLAEQLPRRVLLCAGVLTLGGLLAVGLWPGPRRDVRFVLAGSCLCLTAAALYRFCHGDFGALFSVSMGDRYFFLPKVLILWLLLALAAWTPRGRWLAGTVCGSSLLVAALNWRYERWQDFHWTDYAVRIEAGDRVHDIPLNPHGFKFDYPGHRGGR